MIPISDTKLSHQLQIGKAGEHLVCCDLILQGYNVFLSDQGLPYDIVLDHEKGLFRIQVKTTMCLKEFSNPKSHAYGKIYRWGIRRGRKAVCAITKEFDYIAFVALDIKEVAYFSLSDMSTRNGSIKQVMDLKSKYVSYTGRVYPNGTVRTPEWGRYLQDYAKLEIK